MVSVMGRSCGYGVHLRSCLPSVSSSSAFPPNSFSSLSRLASCFFLRFSSSASHNRRLKLCAAPPFASGRRVLFLHGEAEQEGSSASLPFGLQQSPAIKQGSSRKKKTEGGAEVKPSHGAISLDAQTTHASLSGDASSSSLLSARSKVKVTRRKKANVETPLQASEDSLAGEEKPAMSKSPGKKNVSTDITSMDVETGLADERPSAKLPRRRKKNTTAESEDVKAMTPASFTSSLSQLASSSDAVSSTPKKLTRRKKKPEEESTMCVDREQTASQGKQKSVEEDSNVTCVNMAKSAAPGKRARSKKVVSLVLPQEESSLQAKQVGPLEEMDKNLISKSETLVGLQEEVAKPRGRKKLSSKAKQAALNMIDNDGASPLHLGTVLKVDEPIVNLDTNIHVGKEVEEDSSPKRRRRVSKAKESVGKITSTCVLSTSKPYLSHEVRNVENSVDKASLTDEMPVISLTDPHAASRRKQPEALHLPRDSNMGNLSVSETEASEILTDVSKALPELMSILPEDSAIKSSSALQAKKDVMDQFKNSTSYSRSHEQVKENEYEIFNKVSFATGSDQKLVVPRGMPYKKDPISQTSRANNSGDTFRDQLMPGKHASTPMSSEKINQLKGFPARQAPNKHGNTYRILERNTQSREDINSQHYAPWKKNDTMMKEFAKGPAFQRNERTSNVQFKTASHNNRHLQQGYNLANIDRAYGKEQKKKKEFSIRKVIANQASTTSYMQVFGTGFDTGDTVPTVLLFFDRRRFIFNVGEGLHRFCMEHRFKLSKIDHVFLTRVCSETAGGLPGLILTLAELGESGLTAQTWGPSSLHDLAQAMHTFLPSGWMEHTHCFGADKDSHTLIETSSSPPILLLEDELIKISAVLLCPENKPHHTANPSSSEERNGGMISTVYICELATVRGKFDPDKAQAKGLKPGYKYGKLQKGESVMSDDGTTMVHPEDVLGPSSPGPIMILVDCPSSSHIPSLTSSASLQSYFSQGGKIVNCMIHIGPKLVTRSKEYQSWMENFKETHHIMARKEVKVLGTPTLRYSAKLLSKLNLVCPQLFPIVEPDLMDQKEATSDHMVDGGNLLKYHFRPLTDLGPDVSDVPEAFDHVVAQKHWRTQSPEVMRAQELAGQVIKRWSQVSSSSSSWDNKGSTDCQNLPACLQHVSRDEMELVFLGTGSSQPAKHRNVTGIYVHMFERGGILLDCGEGTYAQLKRRYGAKGADDVLMGLKCIWVSHMHADHFSGIARILSARRQLLRAQSVVEPILVVGPKRLKFFLAAYKQVEDLGVEFLDCSQTTSEVQSWVNKKKSEDRDGAAMQRNMSLVSVSSEGSSGKSGMQHVWKRPGFHIQQGIDVAGREALRSVLNSLGLKDLCSVPVVHCPHAFAVVLEAEGRKINENKTEQGWKLVFSGDTRPCQALVEAAQGATILIHEATFDDGLIAEAVKKNHSMTNEAIQVGVTAQVYRIFLTHFSQRYPTIPSFDNRYSDRTCIAFDMMSVNLADLPIAPKFVPALQLLFRDQTEVEEDLAVSV